MSFSNNGYEEQEVNRILVINHFYECISLDAVLEIDTLLASKLSDEVCSLETWT